MKSRFPGFATVRVACALCGWFRILGHTGSNGAVQALIRFEPEPAPCNVVWSRVIEVSASDGTQISALKMAGYRDLADEWNWRRPHAQIAVAIRSYKALVQGRTCPRCKRNGGVRLDLLYDADSERGRGILVMCEPDAEHPDEAEPSRALSD